MKVQRIKQLVFLLPLIAAAACGGGENAESKLVAEQPPAENPPVVQVKPVAAAVLPAELLGPWTLVAIDGGSFAEIGNAPFMIVAEDGTVGGMSGVNRFNTQVTIEEGGMSFGLAAASKMAGPPEAMKLEQNFMARLGAISTFEVEGDTLRMWAGDNEALTFVRKKP